MKLTDLPPETLRFYADTKKVRLDGSVTEFDRNYLTINGTPETYRWLAGILQMMANSAEKGDSNGHGVVVSPDDLPQVTMTDWDSLQLECRKKD